MQAAELDEDLRRLNELDLESDFKVQIVPSFNNPKHVNETNLESRPVSSEAVKSLTSMPRLSMTTKSFYQAEPHKFQVMEHNSPERPQASIDNQRPQSLSEEEYANKFVGFMSSIWDDTRNQKSADYLEERRVKSLAVDLFTVARNIDAQIAHETYTRWRVGRQINPQNSRRFEVLLQPMPCMYKSDN